MEPNHCLENFRIIWNVFRNLQASSEIFGYSHVVFENPGTSRIKISWHVYKTIIKLPVVIWQNAAFQAITNIILWDNLLEG